MRRRHAPVALAAGAAAAAALALGGGVLLARAQTPPRLPTNAQGVPTPTWNPALVATNGQGTPIPTPPAQRPPGYVPFVGTPLPDRGNTPIPGVPPKGSTQTRTQSPEMLAKERAARAQAGVSEQDATRGKKVRLGNKDVQLPPDAYIEGHVIAEGGVTRILVRRGNAKAFVNDKTGRVDTVVEDPTRVGQMDFLVQALGR